MSEIEKMQRYIDRTKLKNDNYSLMNSEIEALFFMAAKGPHNTVDAIMMAFDYGKAKGCRATKAQVRHE